MDVTCRAKRVRSGQEVTPDGVDLDVVLVPLDAPHDVNGVARSGVAAIGRLDEPDARGTRTLVAVRVEDVGRAIGSDDGDGLLSSVGRREWIFLN